MDKIKIEVNCGSNDRPDWQELNLGGDTKITIHRVNRIFDRSSSGAFSQSIEIDVDANKHIVGNMGEVHGGSVFALNGRKFRYFIGGICMMSGVVKMGKEVEVDGKVSIELASANKEWDDLLEGKGLRDLDLEKEKIIIGGVFADGVDAECWVKQDVYYGVKRIDNEKYNGVYVPRYEYERVEPGDWEKVFLTGMASPKILEPLSGTDMETWEDINTINISHEYDPVNRSHPYMSIRTCFQKYKKASDNSLEKVRGYSVKEADNINSSPCFYALYVLDLILDAIHVRKQKSAIHSMKDIRRLALIHVNIGYTYNPDSWYRKDPNGKLRAKDFEAEIKVKKFPTQTVLMRKDGASDRGDGEKGHVTLGKKQSGKYESLSITQIDSDKGITFSNSKLFNAYATSDNLPNVTFSDYISALENGLGCRFMYDPERAVVDIVLLQDVLTQSEVVVIHGIETEAYKVEKDIRGFVLRYQSAAERKKNAITGEVELTKGDEDTTYNYYDYRNVVLYGPQRTETTAPNNYRSLLLAVNDHNMNLYVNTDTGDEHRVKVDKDAKVVDEWFPSLYEVNGYRDVRIGDCSDMDYVEEIAIGYSPALCNDVNVKEIYKGALDGADGAHPVYATLIDGEILVQDKEKVSDYDKEEYDYENMGLGGEMINDKGDMVPRAKLSCKLIVRSKYKYDRNGSDPFFDGEADFVMGVMRGSGGGAGRIEVDDDFDGEGNARWLDVAGSDSEMYSDSCNSMGEMFDYNGDELVSTKEQAEEYIKRLFPDSNADLLIATRRVSGAEVSALWPDCEGDWATVYSVTYTHEGKAYLMTPITDQGIVFSPQSLEEYFENFVIKDMDYTHFRLLIGVYNSVEEAETYAVLLHRLHAIYYAQPGETTEPVAIENGLGYTSKDILSLKLKAEKPKNGGPDGFTSDFYYPISQHLSKRGIFDKFYWMYAYLMLNGKWVKKKMEMAIADLKEVDMLKKVKIGDVIGFITEYTWSYSEEKGVCEVEFTMVYL